MSNQSASDGIILHLRSCLQVSGFLPCTSHTPATLEPCSIQTFTPYLELAYLFTVAGIAVIVLKAEEWFPTYRGYDGVYKRITSSDSRSMNLTAETAGDCENANTARLMIVSVLVLALLGSLHRHFMFCTVFYFETSLEGDCE